MNSGSVPPLVFVALAVAVSTVILQAVLSRRRSTAIRVVHTLFLIAAPAWVLLGLSLRQLPTAEPLHGALIWLLPGLGLLVSALLRGSALNIAELRAEAAGIASAAQATGLPGLDFEDQLLFYRLVTLLGKPVREVMTPLAGWPSARERHSFDEVAKLMAATGQSCVPVLDVRGESAIGIITSADVIAHLPSAEASGPPPLATDLARPIHAVEAARKVADVLAVLRGEGAGVAAIAGADGRVQGFVSWESIFTALAGPISIRRAAAPQSPPPMPAEEGAEP